MKITFLVAACALGCVVFSAAEIKWNQGSLVLANGEVRQGELAFQAREIVLFRSNNELTVYPAYKINSFFYYDKGENINRKFMALGSENGRFTSFYEVVVWGQVNVVRKLKTRNLTNRKISDKDDYIYFVYQQNLMTALKDFRRKVYPSLVSKSSRTLVQVNDQHLNPNDDSDAIRIVRLYNKITDTEALVAGISSHAID